MHCKLSDRPHGNEVLIMTIRKEFSYPELRRRYKSFETLGKAINRSRVHIWRILSGKKEFTETDKKLILLDQGLEDTSENRELLFTSEGITL